MSAVDAATRKEATVRRFVEEVLNNRNAALVDEIFAPDCEFHALWYQATTLSWTASTPIVEVMKGHLGRPDPNYKNLHTTIDQLFAARDKVVLVSTTKGTRGGREIVQIEIEIDRFVDGKIVEVWWLPDRLGVFQQLGEVLPTKDLVKDAGLRM